jgi:DNA polymerase
MLGERAVYRLPVEPETESTKELSDPVTAGAEGEEEEVAPAWEFSVGAWEDLRMEAATCTLCELCEGRTQVVWGSGTPRTGLMLIGEAPGYHEDREGEAFVGRAGQLLTKILEAIGFGRDEVFITNVLKCRPPGNADPRPTQVAACEPYLISQIEMIRPAVLVTLGRHAARTLLNNDSPMGAMRGRVFQYQGVPLVATYHPAALLRNPSLKRPTWEDVQLVRQIYDDEMALRASGAVAGERS